MLDFMVMKRNVKSRPISAMTNIAARDEKCENRIKIYDIASAQSPLLMKMTIVYIMIADMTRILHVF